MGSGEAGAACQLGVKARSKFPPAARYFYNMMKKAYDAAKRAGNGNEPVKHLRIRLNLPIFILVMAMENQLVTTIIIFPRNFGDAKYSIANKPS